jgi:hypothetical protein
MSGEAGKGHGRRKGADDEAYRSGYDRIFGAKHVDRRGTCECDACKISPHWSDCAVHNEPAYPNGPCDCGGYKPVEQKKERKEKGK